MEELIFSGNDDSYDFALPKCRNTIGSMRVERHLRIRRFSWRKIFSDARCVLLSSENKVASSDFFILRAAAVHGRPKIAKPLVFGNVLRGHQIAKAQEKWKVPTKWFWSERITIFTYFQYFMFSTSGAASPETFIFIVNLGDFWRPESQKKL